MTAKEAAGNSCRRMNLCKLSTAAAAAAASPAAHSATNPGDLTAPSLSHLSLFPASGDFPKEAHQRLLCVSAQREAGLKLDKLV